MAKPSSKEAPPAVQFPKKTQAAKEGVKSVEAKSEPVVQVEYKGDNHHALSHVHHVVKGVNTLPASLWAEAKKHPANVKLIADGLLVGPEDESEQSETSSEDQGE